MDQYSTAFGDAQEVRAEVRRLLLQFERFGLATGFPDYIRLSEEERATVDQSRTRLLNLLTHDGRLFSLDSLGPSELASLRLELVRLCVEGRLQILLAEADIPFPVYNFFAGFEDNVAGPWDRVPAPLEQLTPVAWELMGLPVRFPVGVPASGLTANADWVRYFARRGFNILTYKTVRSVEYAPHAWPHWVFIEDLDPWRSLEDVHAVSGDLDTWPKNLENFSTANSFGVPSPHPDQWRRDVEDALAALSEGQLLILSVMGTSDEYHGVEMIRDFVRVAKLAESTGVAAVELNLSCPNTVDVSANDMGLPICHNAATADLIVEAVRSELSTDTRLIAKLSALPERTLEAVISTIGSKVDGISGINTVQAPVMGHTAGSTPFIGTAGNPEQLREKAGISGAAIKPLGLDFVAKLASLRAAQGHTFDIIGMGGVMDVADVGEYFDRGADAVQAATGACLHPDLPQRLALDPRWSTPHPQPPSRLDRVLEAVATGGFSLFAGRSRAASG